MTWYRWATLLRFSNSTPTFAGGNTYPTTLHAPPMAPLMVCNTGCIGKRCCSPLVPANFVRGGFMNGHRLAHERVPQPLFPCPRAHHTGSPTWLPPQMMVVGKQALQSNRDRNMVHIPAKAHTNNKALGSQCNQLFRSIPKGVSQRRCPMEQEGHHPRVAARVHPTLTPSRGRCDRKPKTWRN